MFARRYTVLIADRTTGVVRRVTISLRAAVVGRHGVLMLPVLIGLGREVERLRRRSIAAPHDEDRA